MKEGPGRYTALTLVLICRVSDSLALRDLPGDPLLGMLAKTDHSLGMRVSTLQA